MDVQLYVYDLSQGMARTMSMPLLGFQIDAIYHTAIVLNNIEYFFGQGIQQSRPGATHHGRPMEIINLGKTQLPIDVILEYLESMKSIYSAQTYELFTRNCNHFSNDFAMFLVGRGIPAHITDLPQKVLDTPFGQMLRPQIDASMRSITQAPLAETSIPEPSVVPQANTNPPRNVSIKKAVKEHGSVYNITDSRTLQQRLKEASEGCAIIFFTSSTCGPCRICYPVFDSLAAENPKAVFIKIDLNEAEADIGSKYQVTGTPTFVFFLRGQKQDEWSGADPGRLRSSVENLTSTAFPGHSHARLDLPSLLKGSLKPVIYTKIPPLDKLIAKMGPDAENSQSVTEMKTLIEARSSSDKDATEVTLPDLVPWAKFLQSAANSTAPESLFAVYDLVRCALLDPRVASWFANEDGALSPITIKSLLKHVSNMISEDKCIYNLRLVTVQLGSTLFASSLFTRAIYASSDLTSNLVQLAATSLLAEPVKPALRAAAAGLAFNLASTNYRSRREDKVEILDEALQIELAAALLEMFSTDEQAGTKDGANAAVMALGYLIYFSDENGGVMDLCKAMYAKSTLEKLNAEGQVAIIIKDLTKILSTTQ